MTFDEFLKEWNGSKVFITAKTSGSTGEPKLIRLSKYFMEKSARRTNQFFDIKKESRLYSCVGADFIGGKMMAVRSVVAGASFSYEKPSNEPLKDINTSEILDLVAVVPSQVPFILENLKTLPKIKNLLIGGSSIHPRLKKRIASSLINAYESYGMTETSSHIALRKITDKEVPFKLLPGIEISTDKDGCLIISFQDGTIVKTYDVAEIISDTEFFIKGRCDQMIISGGVKINPVELETKLSEFINSPFVITGFPDEKWGEKVVLIIEGSDDQTQIKDLRDNLRKVLDKWTVPKEIHYLPSLPRTSNGKIIRIKSLPST